MTLLQSRKLALDCMKWSQPVFFSEEAICYINKIGGIADKRISWRGVNYTMVKLHNETRIVEARRTDKRPHEGAFGERGMVLVKAAAKVQEWAGLSGCLPAHEEAALTVENFAHYHFP